MRQVLNGSLRVVAVLALLGWAATAVAAAPQVELVRRVLLGLTVVSEPIVVNLDGSGFDEGALLAADGGDHAIVVLRWNGTSRSLRPLAIASVAGSGYYGATLRAIEGRAPGQKDRMALFVGDHVRILEGVAAVTTAEYTHPSPWSQSVVADIDGDGDLDLAYVTPWGATPIRAIDLQTGAELWHDMTTDLNQIAVAQLDADAALEVVLNGSSGRILDGGDGGLEWEYAGGFGGSMLIGNVDADALDEVVGMNSALALVFDSMPYAPVLEVSFSNWWDGVGFHDEDGDGRDELWLRQHDHVEVIEFPSGSVRRTVAGPGGSASWHVPGQLDGDGNAEILWIGNEYTTDGEDYAFLLDAAAGTVQTSLSRFSAPFRRIWLADVDGDGQREVTGLRDRDYYYAGESPISTWDFATGAQESTWPTGENFWWWSVRGAALGQLDGDSAREIVLFGSANGVATAMARDGASLAVQWNYEAAESGSVYQGTIASIGPGGRNEVALVVGEGADSRIRVLNGSTGTARWTSLALGNSNAAIDIHAGDIDADSIADITAFGSAGMWNYKADGSFGWSKSATASYWMLDSGVAEIVASSYYGEVDIIDATNRAVTREFDLGGEYVAGLLSLEDGQALLLRSDRSLETFDTMSGTTTPTGIRASGYYYQPIAWDAAQTGALTQTVVLATGYGFMELRVRSAQYIFGGSGGGFESGQ